MSSQETQAPVRLATGVHKALTGTLGVGAIVFMVIAAAAPLTVVGGGAPVGIALGNGAGYPSIFILVGVVLLLFSVGLSAMSRFVPKAGAFFSYVGYGMNPSMGLATAFLALLTYTAVQVAVYALLGLQLSGFVAALGGPELPWWAWTIAMVALVGFLGYRQIDLSSKVLGVLLVLEISVVVVLSFAIMVQGGAEGLGLDTFKMDNVLSGSPGIGVMFAAASFIGFESTAIFRDEAKDPARTIPRATYTAVIVIAVFYVFATWALVMSQGADNIVDFAFSTLDAGDTLQQVGAQYIGGWYGMVITVLLITSLIACVLSFHNVLTRYLHSMSHSKAMPMLLGTVHDKYDSPHVASFTQTASAALLTVLFVVLGMDPYLQVFTWLSGVATLGFLVLMALTCLAVIMFFRNTPFDSRPWQTVIAPTLGLLGLLFLGYLVVANFPLLVGDADADGNPVFGGVSLALLALLVVFPAWGFVQGRVLKRKNPQAYADINRTIAG